MTIFTLFMSLVNANVKHNKEIKESGLLRWLIEERHMPLSTMGLISTREKKGVRSIELPSDPRTSTVGCVWFPHIHTCKK